MNEIIIPVTEIESYIDDIESYQIEDDIKLPESTEESIIYNFIADFCKSIYDSKSSSHAITIELDRRHFVTIDDVEYSKAAFERFNISRYIFIPWQNSALNKYKDSISIELLQLHAYISLNILKIKQSYENIYDCNSIASILYHSSINKESLQQYDVKLPWKSQYDLLISKINFPPAIIKKYKQIADQLNTRHADRNAEKFNTLSLLYDDYVISYIANSIYKKQVKVLSKQQLKYVNKIIKEIDEDKSKDIDKHDMNLYINIDKDIDSWKKFKKKYPMPDELTVIESINIRICPHTYTLLDTKYSNGDIVLAMQQFIAVSDNVIKYCSICGQELYVELNTSLVNTNDGQLMFRDKLSTQIFTQLSYLVNLLYFNITINKQIFTVIICTKLYDYLTQIYRSIINDKSLTDEMSSQLLALYIILYGIAIITKYVITYKVDIRFSEHSKPFSSYKALLNDAKSFFVYHYDIIIRTLNISIETIKDIMLSAINVTNNIIFDSSKIDESKHVKDTFVYTSYDTSKTYHNKYLAYINEIMKGNHIDDAKLHSLEVEFYGNVNSYILHRPIILQLDPNTSKIQIPHNYILHYIYCQDGKYHNFNIYIHEMNGILSETIKGLTDYGPSTLVDRKCSICGVLLSSLKDTTFNIHKIFEQINMKSKFFTLFRYKCPIGGMHEWNSSDHKSSDQKCSKCKVTINMLDNHDEKYYMTYSNLIAHKYEYSKLTEHKKVKREEVKQEVLNPTYTHIFEFIRLLKISSAHYDIFGDFYTIYNIALSTALDVYLLLQDVDMSNIYSSIPKITRSKSNKIMNLDLVQSIIDNRITKEIDKCILITDIICEFLLSYSKDASVLRLFYNRILQIRDINISKSKTASIINANYAIIDVIEKADNEQSEQDELAETFESEDNNEDENDEEDGDGFESVVDELEVYTGMDDD